MPPSRVTLGKVFFCPVCILMMASLFAGMEVFGRVTAFESYSFLSADRQHFAQIDCIAIRGA
jgi:hypothetical protein